MSNKELYEQIMQHVAKVVKETLNNLEIDYKSEPDEIIEDIVESVEEDNKEVIDLLTNQNSFIKETIATLDNIIYGINQKVKIHELLNGLKF